MSSPDPGVVIIWTDAVRPSSSPAGESVRRPRVRSWRKLAQRALLLGVPLVYLAVLLETDVAYEEAAVTLGASPWLAFRKVTLPSLWPAIRTGTLLSFARALGEFGSIVIVSGNIPRRTLTAAVLIYGEIESGHPEVAAAVSTALLVVAFGSIVAVEALQRRTQRELA